MDLLLSTVAMAFGAFAALAPVRAAKIWASGRSDGLVPEHRAAYLRWYRVFGIILFLGGSLLAVESFLFFSR